MEIILILQHILAVALSLLAAAGLMSLKRALLRWSARLSQKSLRRRAN
jgi:hypothetical protein